jgi:hypothetical protein
MKMFKKAFLVGVICAAITWVAVYSVIHEPAIKHDPDGITYVISDPPGDDDDLTALFWAAGAYILTFMPTLFFLWGRTRKDVFAPGQSSD